MGHAAVGGVRGQIDVPREILEYGDRPVLAAVITEPDVVAGGVFDLRPGYAKRASVVGEVHPGRSRRRRKRSLTIFELVQSLSPTRLTARTPTM